MSSAPRLPPLDELTSARFFAAAAVLVGHFSGFLQLPEGVNWLLGGYGVSFFFVLSGFILCYRYWDDFAPGVTAPRYRAFFVARVARIYPSYVAALVLITLLYVVINRLNPGAFTFPANPVESWLANLLSLQTFAPTYATQQHWNGPGWSISTEFSFYAVCPFILALVARYARTTARLWSVFAAAAVFGAVMQTVILVLVYRHGWDRVYWLDIVASRNIFWRIPEFLAGVVAARLLHGGHLPALQRRSARDKLLGASLVLTAVLNAAPFPSDDVAHVILRQYRLDLAYMVPFSGVVLALAAGSTFLSGLLKRPWLVFLGSASYGVYIYHWIAWTGVAHARAAGWEAHPALVAAVVAGVVLFAAASYAWYETPMRRMIRARFEHAPRPDGREPEAMPPSRSFAAAALWIGVPFVLYLLLLRHFWFNVPVWDDYDAMLHGVMAMQDAASPRQWLGALLHQHNEHRVAIVRLAGWSMSAVFGHLDFRALVLAGNAAWLGILLLAWAEFRDRLPAPVFAAAALVTLQLSYYEASLISMSALSNIGVIFFAFACLFFAQRDGAAAASATLVLGALAACSQASGLFALPVAAVMCAIRGRRARAAAAGALAVALWALYFTGYVRPPNHPSVFAALTHPLESIHLFLVIVGGVLPNRSHGVALALALLLALGWALRRGLWRVSPTTVGWLAFVLLSIGAIAAGRVGFGVFHASRYAIPSTCIAMLALLAVAAVVRPPTARQSFAAVAAGALACVAITLVSWPAASEFSFRSRLLARGVPATPEMRADAHFGVQYPVREWANSVLAEAGKRGLWGARTQVLLPTSVQAVAEFAQDAMPAGAVDRVTQEGARLRIVGWSHIPATLPGRTLTLAGAGAPARVTVALRDRVDVAAYFRTPPLIYSGFELEAEYASEAEATRAAASLCLFSETPRHERRRLAGSPGCR